MPPRKRKGNNSLDLSERPSQRARTELDNQIGFSTSQAPKPRRRVVCQCSAYGCSNQSFLDTFGQTQQGQLVLPTTLRNHRRKQNEMEQRNLAAQPNLHSTYPSTAERLPSTVSAFQSLSLDSESACSKSSGQGTVDPSPPHEMEIEDPVRAPDVAVLSPAAARTPIASPSSPTQALPFQTDTLNISKQMSSLLSNQIPSGKPSLEPAAVSFVQSNLILISAHGVSDGNAHTCEPPWSMALPGLWTQPTSYKYRTQGGLHNHTSHGNLAPSNSEPSP